MQQDPADGPAAEEPQPDAAATTEPQPDDEEDLAEGDAKVLPEQLTPPEVAPDAAAEAELGTNVEAVLGQLEATNALGLRQMAAHRLAGLAGATAGDEAGPLLEAMEANDGVGRLLALATEDPGDVLSTQLVLSCLANLSFAGGASLVSKASPAVTELLVRALTAEDDGSRGFAVATVRNLSSEAAILLALEQARCRQTATPHALAVHHCLTAGSAHTRTPVERLPRSQHVRARCGGAGGRGAYARGAEPAGG